MDEVRNISTHVLNVYGFTGENENLASYDTGDAFLTDGVVPLSDVEQVCNRVGSNPSVPAIHTLKLLPGIGHYYREEGANGKLWEAVKEWLLLPPMMASNKARL